MPTSTAAAIQQPLESESIAIDGDALKHVVRESHGYPYFVQVWGQALWQQLAGTAAPEPGRHLTQAVAAAQTDFDREKNNYYLDRFEELERLQLLPIARAVADAFAAQPELDDAGLEAAVHSELGATAGADRLTSSEGRDARPRLRVAARGHRPRGSPASRASWTTYARTLVSL